MTIGADRRSVIAGLALMGLGGCKGQQASEQTRAPTMRPVRVLDLSDLEQKNGGRIGLHALDTDAVSWRAEDRFNYCSTFKLFLAAATQERVQRDNEKLDRAIAITAADMIPHAPVTELAVGKTLTIAELMQAVVEVSDNPAANILIREMGGLDALCAWYRTIGDTTTRVDRLEPFMNRKDGDKDTALPRQTATNLQWMADTYEPLAIGSQYKSLWTWMINTKTGIGRIPAGVPDGWTVAHKTGTGGTGQVNDIGVLYPPTGVPICIAVYYDGPSTLAPAAAEAVVAEATRRAIVALGRAA
ncbi:MAG: bla [Brevundimonas sp.]|nr:bla [Brevundimonas sp.]